jgi:hypothetical protein
MQARLDELAEGYASSESDTLSSVLSGDLWTDPTME